MEKLVPDWEGGHESALCERRGGDLRTRIRRPELVGVRLRTVEDLFAYLDAEDVDLRIDGAEVQVRRPRARSRPPACLPSLDTDS